MLALLLAAALAPQDAETDVDDFPEPPNPCTVEWDKKISPNFIELTEPRILRRCSDLADTLKYDGPPESIHIDVTGELAKFHARVSITKDGELIYDSEPSEVGLPDGAEHVIRLTSGGGDNAITVDGGKTIAIVSSDTDARTIRGVVGASPVLTVTGDGTAYLHHLSIQDGDDVGINVATGGTLYADATQVAQNTGGGITLASGTSGFLRNCMVAGDGGNPGEPAVSASNATVDVLYSTLGLDFNSGGAVLSCSGGDVAVRNSIVISEAATAGAEIDCAGAVVENTAEESTLSPTDWFPQFASGDYSLSTAGGMEFEGDAAWEDGDPPTDFDGDDRPSTDGTPDYAGADLLP